MVLFKLDTVPVEKGFAAEQHRNVGVDKYHRCLECLGLVSDVEGKVALTTLIVLHLAYAQSGVCGNLRYTGRMSRSAIIQARVRPEIKFAGEQVLRSIGLTMTEAMELFLRRLIVDQKIPFEVIALDEATFATIMGSWEASERKISIDLDVRQSARYRRRQKKE